MIGALPIINDENLLVGSSTADDAGVYRISETEALILTVDFFPPIVDDPYTFGQIAAANALSDVFAMGGKPLVGLNIACFPADMPLTILADILRGGQDKVHEAGALIVGGHTVKDKEIKYGVAVTGRILIDEIKTNSSAVGGDLLILTKPLGTGIISTALKHGKAESPDVDYIMKQMSALNNIASYAMVRHKASSATDITGFGLIGHALEMARGSNLTFRLKTDDIPLIPNALRYSSEGFIPGGLNDNRRTFEPEVNYLSKPEKARDHLLYDPQTSGGLLVSASPQNAKAIVEEIKSSGSEAVIIGEVVRKEQKPIVIE